MNSNFKEGDLYKIVTAFGETFEIKYGFYSEEERLSEFGEVMPIYPDFISKPEHTAEGYPFVTQMQDVCDFYSGEEYDDCFSCSHYCHGDELIGICKCPKNKLAV